MKKVIATSFVALMLMTGCGNNEARDDYARCNDEYASGMECTKDEFKDWLYDDAEYNNLIPVSDMEPSNQMKIINEINDKIDEIFN